MKNKNNNYIAYKRYFYTYSKDQLLSISSNVKIEPWYITGFANAESSFKVVVFNSKTVKLGWSVRCEFSIELHKKDLGLLNHIQYFFDGVGRIVENQGRGSFIYIITKPVDLNILIIPHFNKYPLLTQKWADF